MAVPRLSLATVLRPAFDKLDAGRSRAELRSLIAIYHCSYALPRAPESCSWQIERLTPQKNSAKWRLRDGTMKAALDPMGHRRGECDAKSCPMFLH